jgi:membrane protease YdiL (CAAX protease family)
MTGRTRTAWTCWGVYALLWLAATFYLAARGADWSFPILSLGIFGIACSGIAWWLTRKSAPPPIEVARPGVELVAVLGFLLVYAFLFLGWGMGALRTAIPEGPAQEWAVLGVKLVVHVVLPTALLIALGARIRPLFDSGIARRGFWPVLIVLGVFFLALFSVVTPSLGQIDKLHPATATLLWAAPLSFLWIAVEAGLCEEFLFRAVLQSRLGAVLKSPLAAVPIAALLFALAHVPGLYLRGTPETDGWSTDVVQVAAFTIASLSPIAILFGLIWARTRSVLLVVLLHGLVDVLPHLPEFLKTFSLAG